MWPESSSENTVNLAKKLLQLLQVFTVHVYIYLKEMKLYNLLGLLNDRSKTIPYQILYSNTLCDQSIAKPVPALATKIK